MVTKEVKILIAGLLLTMNSMAQFSSHRQLLVFRTNVQQSQQQLELLNKSAEGIKERAIEIRVIEKGSPLFKKYQVDGSQYTVILVGKDGLEKFRGNRIIESDQLFSIIDAMPMRRSEMKKKNE